MPAAVADAIGLRLYAKRRKEYAGQIDMVRKLSALADFPKPEKVGVGALAKMLLRSDVVSWASKRLKLTKDRRGFSIIETGDLPPQDNSANGQLFDAEPNFEKSLDLWQDKLVNPDKWLASPIQSWQMKRLQEYRPYLFKLSDKDSAADGEVFPKYSTLARLPSFYKKRWPEHNLRLSRQQINHWQRGVGIPSSAPFHPQGHDSAGRYLLAECFEWFEKWILPKYRLPRTPELPGVPETEPDLMVLKEREEREQIEFNRWERERERGDWVPKASVMVTISGAIKKHHLFVKKQFESLLGARVLERLTQQGFDSNQLALVSAAVSACGRDSVAAIEEDCAKAAA